MKFSNFPRGKFKTYSKSSLNDEIRLKVLKSYLLLFSNDEISEIFWKYLEDEYLYKFIKVNLAVRIRVEGVEKFKDLIEEILELISSEGYKSANKLRSILNDIKESLDISYKKRIFHILIKSKRRNDRKLASSIAKEIFDSQIEKELWKVWSNFNDKNAIISLLENNVIDSRLHFDQIQELLNSDLIDEWIKRKLLFILARADFAEVDFLKNKDPLTYLYLAACSNQVIDDEFIKDIIQNIEEPELIGIITWSVGKLGKAKLLMEIFDNSKEIKDNLNKNYFNRERKY